jgi:SAM-dependent methyltransferase
LDITELPSPSPPADLTICPNCGGGFELVAERLRLGTILERWRTEAGVVFSAAALCDYSAMLEQVLTFRRCRECRFGMFDPPIPGTAAYYGDILAQEDLYTAEKWEFERALDALGRQRAKTVLDIGCGPGAFLMQVRQRLPAALVFGFEFNEHAVAWAREKGLEMVPALEPDAAPHGGFDAICLFQVLEHLANPFAIIGKALNMLRRGGLLIVTTPDAAGPVRHFPDVLTDIPPHHLTRWQAASMRALAHRFGLKVIDIAHEPLPSYLWDTYLPVMIERDLFPGLAGRALNRSGFPRAFARLLRRIGIRSLPLPGHTLYAAFEVS